MMENEEQRDEVEWSIYLLFDSENSAKPAALFELKIRMTEDGDRIFAVNNELKPIRTFYEQDTKFGRIAYVCCAPLGGSKYFIMPNEINRFIIDEQINKPRAFPQVLFDAGTKEVIKVNPPQGLKASPFVGVVGNKVYVLSRRLNSHELLCEPSFEAYDLETGLWEPLTIPWFNKNGPLEVLFYYPVGFAVFGEFILVSVRSLKRCIPYISPVFSYSTTSRIWKPVKCFPQEKPRFYRDDNDVFDYRVWVGEAVVSNGVIFGHALGSQLLPQGLVSYSCTIGSGVDDIIGPYDVSMGEPNKLCQPNYLEESRALDIKCWHIQSKAVTKLGDGLLFVVNTIHNFEESMDFQLVLVTILRINELGHCSTLKVLELSMPIQDHFRHARISSCLILQQEKMVSYMELGEHDQECRHALPYSNVRYA